MLLSLPSHFCKQIRDYGVQTHQPEVLQNVGHKGRNSDKPEIHWPFCERFFVDDLEPHDSLALQLNRSILHFVTWVGYEVASVWETLEEANSNGARFDETNEH